MVLDSCSMTVMPPVSASLAGPDNVVRVDCRYGQAYSVRMAPSAVDAAAAPDKSAALFSGNPLIVTVMY